MGISLQQVMLLIVVPGVICLLFNAAPSVALQVISAQSLHTSHETSTFVESSLDASSLSNETLPLLNASVASGVILNTTVDNGIRCHGIQYGFQPDLEDCLSALQYIPRFGQSATFAYRDSRLAPKIYPLPFRLMGGKSV